MDVVIDRVATNKDGTFGVLKIDGVPLCVTLEETWLNNQKRISCVPAGKYKVTAYSGTKYKNVFILHDVPNRDAILIHWGNTNDNTAGCILLGQYFADFGAKRGIANSKPTVDLFRSKVNKEFTLEIRDHF